MKMMGMWTPASANSRCKSRPLTPGRLTSRTRQLGPSGGLLRRNSSAVPKDAHRNLADFSSPWMDARTPASSSTTNTVGAADAKPHAGAVRFRCKKRVEDLVRLLRGKPYAGIADGHQNFFFLRSLRLDGQLARLIHFFHRIDAVHDEIHQHLLQLHTVSHDPGKICG